MKANYILFSITAVICAFATSSAQAQNIKIGLVDMQRALNEYSETKIETDKINQQADGFKAEAKIRGEKLKALQEKIKAQTAIVQDQDKNDETRQSAAQAREELLREYGTAQQEALQEGKKSAELLAKNRKEMEVKLVNKITEVMKATSQEQGADLVFDKSFLPRANKAIIFTSGNVLDMTDEIIKKLNN